MISVPRVRLVVGLGFGDEGKGSMVDFFARQAHSGSPEPPLVVRTNGGPQAAHRVVLDDGSSHIFSQLGSGSFVPGTETLLTHFMAIDLISLQLEIDALAQNGVRDILPRLWIEDDCVLVTPWHKAFNRLHERLRGDQRHGSCGVGVGQALLDAEDPTLPSLRLWEVCEPSLLTKKLRAIEAFKREQAASLVGPAPDSALNPWLEPLFRQGMVEAVAQRYRAMIEKGLQRCDATRRSHLLRSRTTVFEGAQGVLLDRHHGFFPHITPSRTTLHNALTLLEEAGVDARDGDQVQRVGIVRAYQTRHGAGPFPTELPSMTQQLPDVANSSHPWQGNFRVGGWDSVLTRYALEVVGGVDVIALTCLDRLATLPNIPLCHAYQSGHDLLTRLEPLPFDAPPERRLAFSRSLEQVQPLFCPFPLGDLGTRGADGDTFQTLKPLLEQQLQTAIGFTSWGETASSKRIHSSY